MMSNCSQPLQFSVETIGCTAWDAVNQTRAGEVIAAFESSFYIKTSAGLDCTAAAEDVGSAAIHRVLNAIVGGNTDVISVEIDGVASIAHRSGRDITMGVINTLNPWLAQKIMIGQG